MGREGEEEKKRERENERRRSLLHIDHKGLVYREGNKSALNI